jgi:hypothetical protein
VHRAEPTEPRSQVTRGILKLRKKVFKVRYYYRGGAKDVSVVLLTPGNESNYCLGRLGRDCVCLMKQDYCDVAKHEKLKLEVPENMIHVMVQAMKHSKCDAYDEHDVNDVLLTEDQYVELTQDQHTVEEWNRILLALSKGDFATASEYDEIKKSKSKFS